MAFRRKAGALTCFAAEQSVLCSPVSRGNREIRASFAYFGVRVGRISLQFRLRGGEEDIRTPGTGLKPGRPDVSVGYTQSKALRILNDCLLAAESSLTRGISKGVRRRILGDSVAESGHCEAAESAWLRWRVAACLAGSTRSKLSPVNRSAQVRIGTPGWIAPARSAIRRTTRTQIRTVFARDMDQAAGGEWKRHAVDIRRRCCRGNMAKKGMFRVSWRTTDEFRQWAVLNFVLGGASFGRSIVFSADKFQSSRYPESLAVFREGGFEF